MSKELIHEALDIVLLQITTKSNEIAAEVPVAFTLAVPPLDGIVKLPDTVFASTTVALPPPFPLQAAPVTVDVYPEDGL